MSRVVIVTGAGGGLGRALVRAVARRGNVAVAFGRDRESLAQTGAGLKPELFRPCLADAGDFEAIGRSVAEVGSALGRIDGLFANAASYPRLSLLDQAPEAWMDVLRVNLGGVMAACRAVLPMMMRTGHGRIVTVGSFADVDPIADSSAYSASKGGLHALTRAIAREVGDDYPDILANEWIPGSLNTAMGRPDGVEPDVSAAWGVALLDLPPGGPTGRIFDRERLVEPPRPFRQRVLAKIGLR